MTRHEKRRRPLPGAAGCPQCPEQTFCPLASLADGKTRERPWPVLFTRYRAGEYVFSENEPTIGLHVVCTGAVTVRSCNEDGQEVGLHLVGTGGYLNATNVVLQDPSYSVSAKVLVDANIAFLKMDELQGLLREQAAFAQKLLLGVCRQMKVLEELHGSLAHGSVCERMLHLLRALAKLGDEHASHGISFPLTIERSDFASLIATTPETISRLLTKLQKAGLVTASKSAIHIPNLERLKTATCCET